MLYCRLQLVLQMMGQRAVFSLSVFFKNSLKTKQRPAHMHMHILRHDLLIWSSQSHMQMFHFLGNCPVLLKTIKVFINTNKTFGLTIME